MPPAVAPSRRLRQPRCPLRRLNWSRPRQSQTTNEPSTADAATSVAGPTASEYTGLRRGLVLLQESRSVNEQVAKAFQAKQETLLVLFADEQYRLLAAEWMGRSNSTTVRCTWRSLFAKALAHDSRAILMAHNHPSGRVAPSAADLAATQQIARMAGLLGIRLLDHLIVADGVVHSMRAAGQIDTYG